MTEKAIQKNDRHLADRICQLTRALRECEAILQDMTPSWEIDSPFHWRIKACHKAALAALLDQ